MKQPSFPVLQVSLVLDPTKRPRKVRSIPTSRIAECPFSNCTWPISDFLYQVYPKALNAAETCHFQTNSRCPASRRTGHRGLPVSTSRIGQPLTHTGTVNPAKPGSTDSWIGEFATQVMPVTRNLSVCSVWNSRYKKLAGQSATASEMLTGLTAHINPRCYRRCPALSLMTCAVCPSSHRSAPLPPQKALLKLEIQGAAGGH